MFHLWLPYDSRKTTYETFEWVKGLDQGTGCEISFHVNILVEQSLKNIYVLFEIRCLKVHNQSVNVNII